MKGLGKAAVPIGVVAIVLMLVVPLPSVVLDMLLGLNITAALLILLVNPTHVAVALKYEADRGAPRVVAKGADEVAATLRERAAEARVPMVQDVPLARALHASCDIGQEVPPQLFTAVARVLAFVMHLSARGVRGGFHRPGFEAPDTADLPRAGRRRTPTAA